MCVTKKIIMRNLKVSQTTRKMDGIKKSYGKIKKKNLLNNGSNF